MLEDCLSSLERLTYPDYEIILVNDGSRDRTSEIGHAHPRVRVIDIHNGGLSAARNAGLAEASGEIVAYTDADVRVDRDWLTFLVQPFLTSDVVCSGGPNVVPSDDPPMAQCIARAPGGPAHVLLDDRIAEHVPGCNMAFRREALLAIDGFNPLYLRAGDDVDVCWRLQARGWKIGFAPSALVWHHHRSSVSAYWRQQVGYGEGETWLMAHHPEKFLDGHAGRGRIYNPLPFVIALGRASTRGLGCGGVSVCIGPTCIRLHFCRIRSSGGSLLLLVLPGWAWPRPAITAGRSRCCLPAEVALRRPLRRTPCAMRSEIDSLPGLGARATG